MELCLKTSTKFSISPLTEEKERGENGKERITGISKNGRISWIAHGAHIEVMSVATGAKVSCYNFQNTLRSLTLSITCVAEINVPGVNTVVLAIGFETSAFDGVLCLFSVQGSRPVQLISIDDGIASCAEIQVSHLNNILSKFDGCLAVGTVSGKIVLVNVNLLLFRASLFASQNILCHIEPNPCTIVPAENSLEASERIFEHTVREKVFFGVEVVSVQDSSTIVSILDLQELVMLATGCLDGSLVLYNLQKLEAIHKAYPPKNDCPLMKLAFVKPADDPRGHVYLWAMHSWRNLPIAVMHSIAIEEKVDENNCTVYKYFKSSRPCLTMPNYSEQLHPLDSQTFIRQLTSEDPLTSICMLSWGSLDGGGKILVFDLNQWYKEQMPEYLEWQEKANFLAIFPLTRDSLRNIWLDENSVTAFNSIQRPEEHFYPNSLTFDCVCVTDSGSYRYHWPGLQNRAIENFMAFGPKAILEPDKCFSEMLDAVLLPQFTEFNHTASSSITAKRDLLLSIALEYNCVGILRECAKVWADGSHLGRQPFEGLSLSTLTEWMWQRVGAIRECCDHLCECLFNLSGRRLDTHSTKTLAHCTRQLRLLAELLEMIMNFCTDYIPQDIRENLTEQLKSMQVSADYHEVLQWLHNMQLLPEGRWISSPKSSRMTSQDTLTLIPYPYPILKTFYDKQRMEFHSLTRKGKFHSGDCSCSLLYIDTFIERECSGSLVRSKWRRSGGNGLYPPATLHAMTSIFHLSDIPVENKYALFMYFLMDLDMAMKNDEKYAEIIRNVIKFPAVFKMNTSLIKTTQAFWKLDHGDLEGALEDLISPLGQDKHLLQWQMELLIECLLVQDNLCLALRAVQSPGPPISPLLEMRCLLANKLVCEAFQLQKSRGDPSLLREFFRMCWELKLIGQILNLALTEADGEVLGEFLQNIDSTFARNLQFSYLLQRSKYMEALSLVAELQKRQSVQGNVDTETPGLVMEAYNSTMTPSVRNLSQMFFKQPSKFQHKSQDPVPLSSNLIKQRKSLEGSIYQKSAAAVEDATLSWLFQAKTTNQMASAPFVRKPIQEFLLKPESKMVYPKVIDGSQKRKMDKDSPTNADDEGQKKKYRLDEHSRHLTAFPQKNKANIFESDLQRQISKLQESIKTQHSVSLTQSMKFFEVESSSTKQAVEESMDVSMTEERTPPKSESFLGATVRPSLRQTPNRSITSVQDSSIDEFFSPDSSRVEARSFDSPKARRSLRSASPQVTKSPGLQQYQEAIVSREQITIQKLPMAAEIEAVAEEEPTEVSKIVQAELAERVVQRETFEIVEVCEEPAGAVISIPEIVITCEEEDPIREEEATLDEVNPVDIPKVGEEDTSKSQGDCDQSEEEEESESSEDVAPPPKRLLLNPAVKFAQKSLLKPQEESASEEEDEESEEDDEEIEVEDDEEDKCEEEESESEEEVEKVANTFKFAKKSESDYTDSEDEEEQEDGENDKEEVEEEEEEEEEEQERVIDVRIPFRKPLVSNEVIDILDSSEDEDRHFEEPQEENRKVMESDSVSQEVPSECENPEVQSEDLYANLEINEESQSNKDELNDALLLDCPSESQDEPMQVSGMEETVEIHNQAALMTTVFSHENTFEVTELESPQELDEDSVEIHNQAALLSTVFSPDDLEPIGSEEPSMEELNTGAIITTVFPNEAHPDIPEESTISEMEKGVVYDEDDDISFKSCRQEEDGNVKTAEEIPQSSTSEDKTVIQENLVDALKNSALPDQVVQEVRQEVEVQGMTGEREEIVEIIPPPKIAYQTTDTKDETKDPTAVIQDDPLAIPDKHPNDEHSAEASGQSPDTADSEEVVEVIPPPKVAYQTTDQDTEGPEVTQAPDGREEVTESIPLPKSAYLTTDNTSVQETSMKIPEDESVETEKSPVEAVPETSHDQPSEVPEEIPKVSTVSNQEGEKKASADVKSQVQEKMEEIEVSDRNRKNKSQDGAVQSRVTRNRKRSSSTDESETQKTTARKTRAASVPKMSTIAEENPIEIEDKQPMSKRRKSRAPSETKDTPLPAGVTTRRKSIILEQLDSPGNTPARIMTRRRSSILQEDTESPASTPRTTRARSKPLEAVVEQDDVTSVAKPRKRRAQSEDSHETEKPSTRSRSKTPLQSPIPKEPAKKTRSRAGSVASSDAGQDDTPSKNLRTRKRSVDQGTPEDDARSDSSFVMKRRNIRASSKPPNEPDIKEEEAGDGEESYSDTRRLTRGQKAVLEKVSRTATSPPAKKTRRVAKKMAEGEDDGSDQESVVSEKSSPGSVKSRGSRVSRTSKASRGKREVSVESTTSTGSKSRGRGRKTPKELVPESDDTPSRALRKRKQ